jgi:hypothetical protein
MNESAEFGIRNAEWKRLDLFFCSIPQSAFYIPQWGCADGSFLRFDETV